MPVATIIKPNESKSTSKVRYTITYSSWSSTVNADGYYTYALSLTRPLKNSIAPTVYIAGSSDTTQPMDTHKTMFSYVERCYLSGSSLTLYAKTKPTSTFYIWVEGVSGSGSGSIVGNVIQPNGSGGGGWNPTLIASHTILTSDLTTPLDTYFYEQFFFTAAEASLAYNANYLLYEILWVPASGGGEVIVSNIINVAQMKAINSAFGSRAYFSPTMMSENYRVSQMTLTVASNSSMSVYTIVNSNIKTTYGNYSFIHRIYKLA